MPPAWADPCNGHHVHEQVRGRCPIEIVAANRVVNGARRAATVGGVLPVALQDTISTSDMAFLNVVDHSVDIEFDFTGATVAQLFEAAKSGVVNPGDVMAELGGRIPTADAAVQSTLGHTISAIENLVKVGHIVKNSATISGNMLRLWACTTKKMKKLTGPIVVVEANTLTLTDDTDMTQHKSRLSVDRLTSEPLFDAAVYQWALIAHSVGLLPMEISAHFIFEVAFLIRIKHGESFWTAQEYFIACLDLLDLKKVKVSAVPNFDRSVMLSDARRFGEQFAAKHGRPAPALGEPSSTEKKPWNGEYQPADKTSIQPCPYFNKGLQAHDSKHLTAAGKCVFRHVCSKWVTDKGPGGRCESADHSWAKCNNPNKSDTKQQ